MTGGVPEVADAAVELATERGRLAGRVESLQWAQLRLQELIARWRAMDRFADTRGLEEMLALVRDSLRLVQDGSGDPTGLVVDGLGALIAASAAEEAPSSPTTI